jgi:hypothetical protein
LLLFEAEEEKEEEEEEEEERKILLASLSARRNIFFYRALVVVRVSFFSPKIERREEKNFSSFFSRRQQKKNMYLMYYLNEDGKRVYTLKVRHSFDRSLSIEALSLSRLLVYSLLFSLFHKKKFRGSNYVHLTQFSSLFSLRRPPPSHKLNSENRSGWEADAFRAPGEILPGR